MSTMSTEKTCPNYEKCPIYTGVLKDMSFTSSAYKQSTAMREPRDGTSARDTR